MATRFTVRPVSSVADDGLRILKFVDSQIPFLKQVGSEGQWGSELISHDTSKQERYRRMVKRAESEHPWGHDWTKAFIADAEVNQDTLPEDLRELARLDSSEQDGPFYSLAVAAIVLEAHSEDYVRAVIPKQDCEDPFVYVRFLVTDRRTGAYSKSAANALLDHAKSIASTLGISRLCLDCWSGNNRKLVKYVATTPTCSYILADERRYYESCGFRVLGNVVQTNADHEDWPAAVLELRLSRPK